MYRNDNMTTKDKPTREHIIDCAFDLFITKGYHGTSMRDIANVAGLAVSGIYNHFSKKEAIFEAIIRRWHPFVRLQPELGQVTGDTVRDRLFDTIKRVIAVYDSNPNAYHLLFIEIVEFDGKHMSQLYSELQAGMFLWMQDFKEADGMLTTDNPVLLFQWLMSVLFAYSISGRILTEPIDIDAFIAMYCDGMSV